MATFPLSTRRFTSKRDLVDIVEDYHVNDIQSEIEAIEDTLGTNPHQDNLGTDKAWQWGSVRERLEYMIRGRQLAVWGLYAGAGTTHATDTASQVSFPAPVAGSTADTHGLFSANAIRVKRNGFYHFTGRAYFSAACPRGSRRLTLHSNHGDMAHVTELVTTPAASSEGDWLCLSWNGYLAAGDAVDLRTNLITGSFGKGKYSVSNIVLDGHMVRDL